MTNSTSDFKPCKTHAEYNCSNCGQDDSDPVCECGVSGNWVGCPLHNPKTKTDPTVCHWTAHPVDASGFWETDCNEAFGLNEGTPSNNGMKFCCYCGKKLVEVINGLD